MAKIQPKEINKKVKKVDPKQSKNFDKKKEEPKLNMVVKEDKIDEDDDLVDEMPEINPNLPPRVQELLRQKYQDDLELKRLKRQNNPKKANENKKSEKKEENKEKDGKDQPKNVTDDSKVKNVTESIQNTSALAKN